MSHIRNVPAAWNDFIDLNDTPAAYTSQAGKFLRVNSTPDGIEFTDDVVQKSGSTMSGFLTLHADPTQAYHAATKQYVDAAAQGLDFKASVRAATTVAGGNITLSGEQTIDGVSVVAGDRVLVKNQSTASQNGIYVAAAGAWSRSADANDNVEVTAGMFTFVEEGTANADTGWVLSTNNAIVVGTTALTFVQFSGAGTYTAGNGLVLSGSEFSVDYETTDGNIQSLGTADAGSSVKVARADHVHAHGNLLGGTLHADVIAAGASGFMSGTDKSKLDGIASGAEVNQNAWGVVDINAAETVLTAGEDADTLKFVEANVINIAGSGGDTVTIGLTAGSEGQVVQIVSGIPTWATLTAGAVSFLGLTDTPSDFTDDALKFLRVNAGEDAVEFVTIGTVPTTGNTGSTLYYNSGWVESNVIFNDHTNAEVGINTQTPNSTLHVNGSFAAKIVTITDTYDLGSGSNEDVRTLLCNNTSGGATVTLPAVASSAGREYHIKKISTAGNDVTLDGNSNETIDGATTYVLDKQYESVTLVCDGSAWYIV
jgi:hypothetical protein